MVLLEFTSTSCEGCHPLLRNQHCGLQVEHFGVYGRYEHAPYRCRGDQELVCSFSSQFGHLHDDADVVVNDVAPAKMHVKGHPETVLCS
jgi:hypothetical protein